MPRRNLQHRRRGLSRMPGGTFLATGSHPLQPMPSRPVLDSGWPLPTVRHGLVLKCRLQHLHPLRRRYGLEPGPLRLQRLSSRNRVTGRHYLPDMPGRHVLHFRRRHLPAVPTRPHLNRRCGRLQPVSGRSVLVRREYLPTLPSRHHQPSLRITVLPGLPIRNHQQRGGHRVRHGDLPPQRNYLLGRLHGHLLQHQPLWGVQQFL